MITVISTGSRGNAVLYDNILVDCGVSYKSLAPFLDSIKLVLLTHIHQDHFKPNVIRKIAMDKPLIRFVCCEWLAQSLFDLGVRNIDVLEIGKLYDYKIAKVSPVKLYHDVPNCGWRIFTEKKIFHATDTYTLDGISAKGYDVYAIEHNYDEEILEFMLENSTEYEHGHRSKETHLSAQQAQQFIDANSAGDYEVVELHESTRYGGVE
ncbi:hypothetical protein G7062_11430 [Erysipelothrix sp. HDW6C]|uniref:MBL fold metallo-hydrolase n=1 Tax=Erysipelothrix sp. HDW6C TaxID=2714930 RepID=UPI001407C0C6|nr:MBL fold metallo-hydrolase [Erysipelothrix sp. HDW6C]QIK70869.1 hypothetical protein G7062_11430 [Erysipelothrix sp. HDW6C]